MVIDVLSSIESIDWFRKIVIVDNMLGANLWLLRDYTWLVNITVNVELLLETTVFVSGNFQLERNNT